MAEDTIKRIAIVIPVFNGLKFLQKSVPGIIKQINEISDWHFSLIIVDDNSSDGTASWLKLNYPEIIVLPGTGSLWWSGGVNAGIKYALSNEEYKYILLWNHDILCDDNYFHNLIRVIPDYDQHTIIASKIYFLHKPDVIFNMGAYFNPTTGQRKLIGYNQLDSQLFNKPVNADWTGGMGTLIPRDVFKKVGLFDEIVFPQYFGDADFLLRAKRKGYKLIVNPDLKIWNDKSSSGLEHKNNWALFLRSHVSKRSNTNVLINYRFLRRHANSPVALLYYMFEIVRHFGSFLKNWIQSLIN